MCVFKHVLLMPRLSVGYGVHRAPTVGLVVVAALLSKNSQVHIADLFPMSMFGEQVWSQEVPVKPKWQAEAERIQRFFWLGAQFALTVKRLFEGCQLKVVS